MFPTAGAAVRGSMVPRGTSLPKRKHRGFHVERLARSGSTLRASWGANSPGAASTSSALAKRPPGSRRFPFAHAGTTASLNPLCDTTVLARPALPFVGSIPGVRLSNATRERPPVEAARGRKRAFHRSTERPEIGPPSCPCRVLDHGAPGVPPGRPATRRPRTPAADLQRGDLGTPGKDARNIPRP